MVLVDTGVWIDFFAGKQIAEVDTLISLLEREEALAFTGLILQELMQGRSNEVEAAAIEERFASFVELSRNGLLTNWQQRYFAIAENGDLPFEVRLTV